MTQPPHPGPHSSTPPGAAPPPPPPQPRPPSARLRELVGLAPFVGLSLLLVVVMLVVATLVGHGTGFVFLLRSMFTSATTTALVACAVALTLHARSIDLSIVGTVGLCGLVFASIGGVPGVLVALLVALLVGVVNAALVGVLRLNPVAATLGTAMIMTAIVLGKTRGQLVMLKHVLPTGLVFVVLVLLVLAAVAVDVFHLFVPGRPGMPEFLHRSLAHLAAAGLAGLGGVVQVLVIHSSVENTSWWILVMAFAAAFLGGTSASGHARSLVGAVLAAGFVASTTLVLTLTGKSSYLGYAIIGVVLVLAVGGDRLRTFLLEPKAPMPNTPPRPAGPAQ